MRAAAFVQACSSFTTSSRFVVDEVERGEIAVRLERRQNAALMRAPERLDRIAQLRREAGIGRRLGRGRSTPAKRSPRGGGETRRAGQEAAPGRAGALAALVRHRTASMSVFTSSST